MPTLGLADAREEEEPHGVGNVGHAGGAVEEQAHARVDLERVLDRVAAVVRKGEAIDVSNPGHFAAAGPARINVPLVYSEKFAANRAMGEAFMVAYMKGVRVYNDAFVKNIDKEKSQHEDIL